MTVRRTTLGGHTHEFPSLSDLLATRGATALQYGSGQGDPALR